MGQLLGPDFPTDIALAVSGGGDSMAMLTLAHNWAHRWGTRLWVVTVDHGLRPEAAAEAAMVAEECRLLGHPHATLRWHWDGTGNKMDQARRARLDLIDRWRGGLQHVLMAHTRDDVAETFLMRLKRGSGVDGLSAMVDKRALPGRDGPLADADRDGARPPGERSPNWQVIRPCLDMARSELRHYLRTLQGRWVEDPSNDDPAYDRVQMRRLLEVLEAEGFDRKGLADTAHRLRQDRQALSVRAAQVWQSAGREDPAGVLSLAPGWFDHVETTTRRRLLGMALRYVAAAEYGPRAEPLDSLLATVTAGGGGTLHGVEAAYVKGRLTLFREYAAVADSGVVVGDGQLWDGRWQVSCPDYNGLHLRALGPEGWRQAGEKPAGSVPHRVALSLPAIWRGDRLVACDALGVGPGGTTHLCPMGQQTTGFKAFLLSH
ncbi:tRNA lysidine(34) synthetase TilS [Tropicibacter oceani]